MNRVAQKFNSNQEDNLAFKERVPIGERSCHGELDPDLSNKRKGNSGQKGIDVAYLIKALEEVPIKSPNTQRSGAG